MLAQMRRPAEYVQTEEYIQEEIVQTEEVTYANTNQGYGYNNNGTSMQMMRPHPHTYNHQASRHQHNVVAPQAEGYYGNKPHVHYSNPSYNAGYNGNPNQGYNDYCQPSYGVVGNGNMYPNGGNNRFGYNRASEVSNWMGRGMEN